MSNYPVETLCLRLLLPGILWPGEFLPVILPRFTAEPFVKPVGLNIAKNVLATQRGQLYWQSSTVIHGSLPAKLGLQCDLNSVAFVPQARQISERETGE